MRTFPILLAVCATGAVAFASTGRAGQPVTQTLNPPAPSYYTCKATGDKTICTGNPPTESYGPIDTADEGTPIVCGSGPAAFHVFDAGTDEVTARRVYDSDGNLVQRVLTDDYTFGEFSNPLTGASVRVHAERQEGSRPRSPGRPRLRDGDDDVADRRPPRAAEARPFS